HEMLHGRGPAHRLLDEFGNEAAILLNFAELARVLAQGPDGARRRRRSGIVPGGGYNHVIAHCLEMTDGFPIDLRVGNYTSDVLAPRLAPRLSQSREIGLEVCEHFKKLLDVRCRIKCRPEIAGQFLILPPKQLLRA